MLNLEFVKWIALAIVIGSVAAYFFLQGWLNNFAVRTKQSWWIFVLVGTFVILISVLTVSWQSYRAAIRNPVESLKYE